MSLIHHPPGVLVNFYHIKLPDTLEHLMSALWNERGGGGESNSLNLYI